MGLPRLRTAAAPLFKAEKDRGRLTVTAALTYPGADRAGDRLTPAGGRYEVHKTNPWVGYEHLRWDRSHTNWVHADDRTASLNPVVVGTAAGPDGYAVVHKAVDIDGRTETLPFGTTYFDPHDRLSAQTFALVEDDTLPAVSLELTLVKGRYRELARSPLEPHRPAYEMAEWNCLGWVHCAEPVNPGALTLRKALTPATERALRVAELGRVGGEVAHPLLLKALRRRYAPALGKSNTVTSGYAATPVRKAMPDDAAMEAAYAPEEEAAEPEATGGGSTPTVQALYQLAQSLTDLKGQVEELLAGSEHVKGRKYAQKLLADLDGTVEDATEMAAKIEAELGAKADDAGDEPAEEPEPDVQADDTEPDEDGVLKAIKRRPAVFKAIRRFTVAEFRKAQPVEPAAAPEPADDLVSQLEALQQSDPEAYAKLARRAERKLARA